MLSPTNAMIERIPQSRVELHVHLDGSVRHETIWELARTKGLPLPGKGTFEDLRDAMIIKHPKDLHHFLQPFAISSPCLVGDLAAIERVAYEFCEDKAKSGVMYVEARYSPHTLLSSDQPSDLLGAKNVVRAVNRGFERGQSEFHIKVRSILCTLGGSHTAMEVVELCDELRNEGIVGMDMASMSTLDPKDYVEVPATGIEVEAFQKAYELKIHRTVHAGESGSAEMINRALTLYKAERIGHGYHLLEDPQLYKTVLQDQVHLENCPWSSYLTGAVPLNTIKHPIAQFAEDGANFSISSDDSMCTGRPLDGDYKLAASCFGLSEAHFIRANFNAARSSFLPTKEKQELILELMKTFGLDTCTVCA